MNEIQQSDHGWRARVSRVIAGLCADAYKAENYRKDGTKYKRHRAYHVPDTACELLECLNSNNEERAKSIMAWDYHARKH
jgi:hypothetical protein